MQLRLAKSTNTHIHTFTDHSRMKEGEKNLRMQLKLKCRQMSLKRKTLVMLTCRFLRHLISTTFAQNGPKRAKIDTTFAQNAQKRENGEVAPSISVTAANLQFAESPWTQPQVYVANN